MEMPLEKQVVSLELSKELKETGYPQKGLWAWYSATDRDDEPRLTWADENSSMCALRKQAFEEKFVAPTVAELGKALPNKIKCVVGEAKLFIQKDDNGYFVYYAKQLDHIAIVYSEIADTEANCRAKIYICLKKQGLL